MLVIGVVSRGEQSWGDVGPGKGPAGLNAAACRIIGVGQRPERGRPLLVRDRRAFGGHVVGIGDTIRIRIGHAGTTARIIELNTFSPHFYRQLDYVTNKQLKS